MKPIYCDIAATTPLDPQVSRVMAQTAVDCFGNPSSIHRFGQQSKTVVEKARRQIAAALGAAPAEIFFTSAGSEANNLALKGLLKPGDHLVTSTYEHPSVRKTATFLEENGISVTWVKPDSQGLIQPRQVADACQENTRLISIMFANNELGTINPIGEIAGVARLRQIPFHTDAVQVFGKIPVDVNALGVDLLSMSAHKLYGPKGVGALYIRRGIGLQRQIHGGSQESNLRAGTENVAGIAGFGLAAELATNRIDDHHHHLNQLTDLLEKLLAKQGIHFRVNGTRQLPGVRNITFFQVPAQALVIRLDQKGIAISAGSACASGTAKPPITLTEIGLPEAEALSSVRISFGKYHTPEDIQLLVEQITHIVRPLQTGAKELG